MLLDKWSWKMDYCLKMGLPPAQEWAWQIAEKEFRRRTDV